MLQKPICAIDTDWFVSSAVWKLLANCLGNVQNLICVCAWLLASCLCSVQKLIWSLCIPIGLLVLLRAGLHASYLNAAQKPIEAIDTYLFVWLCVGLLALCLGVVQNLIWSIFTYTYWFVWLAVRGPACKNAKMLPRSLSERSKRVNRLEKVNRMLLTLNVNFEAWTLISFWNLDFELCAWRLTLNREPSITSM